MAGIYLHIPFCKQACHYCDFHFSTALKDKPAMVAALCEELCLRRDYLPEEATIETIYFGGGTPSLLQSEELSAIFQTINRHYQVSEKAEITLEANPDDLSMGKLQELKDSPVNRLSIGIQSFFEEDLSWMNRAHTAREAQMVLENAVSVGFTNLTADLIYGYPLLTDEKWEANINRMLQSGIRHLSAYSMTVEQGTPLASFIRKRQQKPMDEEQSARQFLLLMEKTSSAGWEQYEIANFAKGGEYSEHNTNYWRGQPYLGIGPSAHSFDGNSRQWNTRVNSRYLKGIATNAPDFQKEILTPENQFNEYLMTALRTCWGVSIDVVKRRFGSEAQTRLLADVQPFLRKEQVALTQSGFKLTTSGKLFADHIASELFV